MVDNKTGKVLLPGSRARLYLDCNVQFPPIMDCTVLSFPQGDIKVENSVFGVIYIPKRAIVNFDIL